MKPKLPFFFFCYIFVAFKTQKLNAESVVPNVYSKNKELVSSVDVCASLIVHGNVSIASKQWTAFEKSFVNAELRQVVFAAIIQNSYPKDQSPKKFDSLVSFILSEKNIELQGYGFQLLFDTMTNLNHLVGENIIPFALTIKKQIDSNLQLKNGTLNANDLQYYYAIKEKLPDNVKVIAFSQRFRFRSNRGGYMFATDKFKDGTRRHVYRRRSGTPCCHIWELTSADGDVGRIWHIKNIYYGEYLYISTNPDYFDDDRRILFTWNGPNDHIPVQEAVWQFVSNANTIEIRNSWHGREPIYADEDNDGDNGKLFTPVGYEGASYMDWYFESA